LRGIYEVGPDAEFGVRAFPGFVSPIQLEAADEIERLKAVLQKIANQSFSSTAQIWAKDALEGCK
jgi:hypothetical protein